MSVQKLLDAFATASADFTYGDCTLYCSVETTCPLCKKKVPKFTLHQCSKPIQDQKESNGK